MARRRDFVRGASAIRTSRKTTWFQFEPAETTISSGSTLIFSLNAAALAMRPFTIVRSRFEIALRSDQTVALENQVAGFGIAVVSDQAVVVGVTAVPTPLTEMGSHLWLMHSLIYSDESQVVDNVRPQAFKTLDSKAMRKVETGSDIVVVAEKLAAADGMVITIGGRMLVKNN